MADLPSYDDLPVTPGAPAGSAWGLWGDGDRLGCLNLLTPERARRGAACVRTGATYSLNLELELPDPPLYGRRAPEHVVHRGRTSRDDELAFNTQASSQWDGFRHIGHPEHGFYGGVGDDSEHGMHHWAARGIVGRAVVADVARWRERQGRPLDVAGGEAIPAAELLATLEDQGTAVEPGDVLLLRTGWLGWYRAQDGETRRTLADGTAFTAPGLAPGEASARMLWNLHVAAVAADNPALERWPIAPDQGTEGFLHYRLLPLLGIPIGELFELDALAADCAADGTWDCLFTSAPLHLAQGVASPPNALAVR